MIRKTKVCGILTGHEYIGFTGTALIKINTAALHVLVSVFCVFYVNIADEPGDWLNSFWTSFALAHRYVWPHFHARTWLEKHHSWFIREQVIIQCPGERRTPLSRIGNGWGRNRKTMGTERETVKFSKVATSHIVPIISYDTSQSYSELQSSMERVR